MLSIDNANYLYLCFINFQLFRFLYTALSPLAYNARCLCSVYSALRDFVHLLVLLKAKPFAKPAGVICHLGDSAVQTTP